MALIGSHATGLAAFISVGIILLLLLRQLPHLDQQVVYQSLGRVVLKSKDARQKPRRNQEFFTMVSNQASLSAPLTDTCPLTPTSDPVRRQSPPLVSVKMYNLLCYRR